MNDREACQKTEVFEFPEPLLVFFGQLLAGPVDGFGSVGVESLQIGIDAAVFVVVALDARHAHRTDDVETLLGVGVVSDDIAQAGVVGAILGFGILKDHLQSFQVCVDIGDDGVLHLSSILKSIIR